MKFPRSTKGWSIGTAVALALILVTVGGTAAFASGTYKTLAAANIRSAPSTTALIIGYLGNGQSITIDCYLNGTNVSGTTIWDHINTGGFVSDALVLTHSAGPVVPSCAPTPAPVTKPAPSCNGASCDSKNPQSTNCVNDAITLKAWNAKDPAGATIGMLEMRYSPSCYSNWVRFTPQAGITGFLGNISGGTINSTPYIWRLGVANSLRGFGGENPPSAFADTVTWSQMVTAAGTTCSSVAMSDTAYTKYGGGATSSLGTFNAPCIS